MFGLIGHLTSLEYAQSLADRLGYPEYAEQGLDFWCMAPPHILDEIKVRSVTGQVIEGRYVESCFVPEMLAQNRFKAAMRKVLNAMAHAQKHGIDITALGGFTSIIFENFNLEQIRDVRNVSLDFRRFTTGNTHTAYIITQQMELAARDMDMHLQRATILVCGASGDIGSAVCRWIAHYYPNADLILVARNQQRLQEFQQELGMGRVLTLEEGLPLADVIVWVASMPKGLDIDPAVLKNPCLVIDGGYPKNLRTQIQRPGVRVLQGGMVEHALEIDWRIMEWANLTDPGRHLYACFAEAMLLEFEGWYTNFSWGRNQITLEKMAQIGAVSRKHGFQPLLS
ncbi:MAG: long-chain acyl-[acyl-carrier-protein] reductase [Gloeomargarita sp. SKYG116]|nr:long-chain acyl-[acyl-carrier-protein] reductase [Gloeomargarita sp. SKYG116]MCS7225811.1 long-chain acyl-[acyl-carrier-protein] reductase [Gloeomargarita sp. SKYB31]MDW8401037.1 long-chain acyl-[acyl-carrier-protein] reductase [Gloeomargarita sp. SKYGB_i_bin116]